MRVVLEIASGPNAGCKTLLRAGEVVQVGRTEWADISVAHDGQMSAVHFSLETDHAACYLQDLGSSNGTILNGQPLQQRMALNDGDEIVAGQTRFSVHIEGAPSGDLPQDTTRIDAAMPAAAGQPIGRGGGAGRADAEVSYSIETCSSGLTLCQGSILEISPADLAARMAEATPLCLMVDFKALPGGPREELIDADYLFDWIDPAAAPLVSPVVITPDELATWPQVVEQGWGNDAVVCLFSKQDKPSLLAHLRDRVHAKPNREDHGGGILGICWPGVLAMLLSHQPPAQVDRLLTGIDAVMLELPDLPETWQVFGHESMPEMLDQLGFVRQPLEEAASAPEGEA